MSATKFPGTYTGRFFVLLTVKKRELLKNPTKIEEMYGDSTLLTVSLIHDY
jgi:hypothetical protein